MQERGLVNRDEHRIQALVPRQDLTGPERTWAARYEFNDVVRYARASKETGMERGEAAPRLSHHSSSQSRNKVKAASLVGVVQKRIVLLPLSING
jgi:hypothetical protein